MTVTSGKVTISKDSGNLIGISIGGGAPLCPCLYIVQVRIDLFCLLHSLYDPKVDIWTCWVFFSLLTIYLCRCLTIPQPLKKEPLNLEMNWSGSMIRMSRWSLASSSACWSDDNRRVRPRWKWPRWSKQQRTTWWSSTTSFTLIQSKVCPQIRNNKEATLGFIQEKTWTWSWRRWSIRWWRTWRAPRPTLLACPGQSFAMIGGASSF